jgi:hypothetical protein
MSILQITPDQGVSTILHTLVNGKPAEVEWPAYASACDQRAGQQIDAVELALNRKRRHAWKYLHDRMRTYGEHYSKAEPRVFTPQFVSELGRSNSEQRLRRNPWLEIHGIDEDGLPAAGGNVLPFGPQIVAQDDAAKLPG